MGLGDILDFFLQGPGMAGLATFDNIARQARAEGMTEDQITAMQSIFEQRRVEGVNQTAEQEARRGEAETVGETLTDVTRRQGENLLGDYADRTTSLLGQGAFIGQAIRTGYQDQFGDFQTGFGEFERGLGTGFDEFAGGVRDEFGGIAEGVHGGYEDLAGRFDTRTGDILGQFEGLGDQARTDVRSAFDRRGEDITQQLASQGLGSTTVGASLQQGNLREQEAELRRLNADLRRERIGFQTGLTGEALGARERGIGAWAAAGFTAAGAGSAAELAGLGSRERLGLDRFDREERLGGDVQRARAGTMMDELDQRTFLTGTDLDRQGAFERQQAALEADVGFGDIERRRRDATTERGYRDLTRDQQRQFIQGINVGYPQGGLYDPLLQYGAYANAPQPEQPGFLESLAGPGLQAAGTIAAAKIVAACIDADSHVITPAGIKTIRNVAIGERVMNADGRFVEIVGKDCGATHAERLDDFVRILIGDRAITLTNDHVVGGTRAGDWTVGDVMETRNGPERIAAIDKAESVESADIALADDSDYVVDGFVVTSILSKLKVSST